MELEQAKKLIEKQEMSRKYRKYKREGYRARRYYICDNDIKHRGREHTRTRDAFRVSDHRIASNFFRVLVDQKSSYLFGNPPTIDVGNDWANEEINRILGEQWGKNLKKACVLASIWTDAWIQYWVNDDGEFKYTVISESKDVLASWGGYSNEELVLAVKATEDWLDPETGEYWNLYEIWTNEKCYFYRYPSDGSLDDLEEEWRDALRMDPGEFTKDNSFTHEYGEVPFIHLKNNSEMINDLIPVKEYIDAYDEAMSTLADDITDCQNAIMVLRGYGDQDPNEFWQNIQENRLINLTDVREYDEDEDIPFIQSDAQLLTIEPPIAATQLSVDLNRKAAFEQGHGVDPQPEVLANTSGVALKHTYNLLELKSKTMEDEFRIGIARLVKAICRHIGYELPRGQLVKQTWKRTRINNDTELIENAKNSVGILSDRTIREYHPWVDDPEEEERRLAEEKTERTREALDRAQSDLIMAMRERDQAAQKEQERDGGDTSSGGPAQMDETTEG